MFGLGGNVAAWGGRGEEEEEEEEEEAEAWG